MLAGLQKTTLVNFPKRVASAVFLPGCNMRCPYCYNKELAIASPVTGPTVKSLQNEYFPLDKIYEHLEKRAGLITGVVISGGEPFVSPYLEDLIKKIKSLKLAFKLDTNGLFPEKLKALLKDPKLCPDMVALDIKTSSERYSELFPEQAGAGKYASEKLLSSIDILSEFKNRSNLDIEFRTVLVPPLVGKTEITRIASLLPKDAIWKFADFSPSGCLNPSWDNILPYTSHELKELEIIAQKIIPGASLRLN